MSPVQPAPAALAAQVLDLVRTQAGRDLAAEVRVARSALALTRFANSYIHQNLSEQSTTVELRLHGDGDGEGRTAAGSTNITSPDGLAGLVHRTLAAVRVAPRDAGWPGLAPPAPVAGAAGFDEATATADPAQRARLVHEFVAQTEGLLAAGYVRCAHWSISFANSAGQAVTTQTTDASFDGLARGAGGDGVARRSGVRLADLDATALGARAAAKARSSADPVELPPGRYEVVLEPAAVADLLSHLGSRGFNGKAHAQGQSYVVLGEAQLDPAVTIVDDPFAPATPALAVDAEGTPKQRLVLVAAGVSTAVAHDRRSAALAGGGATSTGHAAGPGGWFGPAPVNLGLLPDLDHPSDPAELDIDPAVDPAAAGLLAGVERGLLITDLHYTRVLDPKTLVVTGLTRNGVWLIEDGKLARPVQNLRFTQSYPQALAPGAVRRVGPAATLIQDSWDTAWWRAPALHLAAWNITGNASG